jgi:hypothetical protein
VKFSIKSSSAISLISLPFKVSVPAVGVFLSMRSEATVDLPQPDSPTIPTKDFSGIFMLIPWRISRLSS